MPDTRKPTALNEYEEETTGFIDMRDFHFEEYKALRAEILAVMQRIHNYSFYGLLAIGASMAWIGNTASGIDELGWCVKLPPTLVATAALLPISLLVLLIAFYGVAVIQLNQLAKYIKSIETRFGDPKLGWEHFLSHERQRQLVVHLIFWGSIFIFVFLMTLMFFLFFQNKMRLCQIA